MKDLLSMALPIRTRPSFPLSQSLPSGNFHKPLILLHQRADRLKTTMIENWTTWSHGPQPCLTQWNNEPGHVGPTKMDRSWWRVLIKHGPLEKGMANHFSILALRTPWTVWKGSHLSTLKYKRGLEKVKKGTRIQWQADSCQGVVKKSKKLLLSTLT